MQIIAIVNEKGGTGKTTTAVNLSAALGSLGRRVLLVDLDGQAASSRWLGVEEDNRLADALLRGGGLEPLETVSPGVSLAPATGKLDSVAHDLRPSQGGQLRKVLREIRDRYDLILVDCPPSLGNRLIGNALLAATHVLVPVETSILALDGLKILLTTLEDIREGFGHDLVLAGVLACRYDGRTRLSRLVLEELNRALPNKVFHTVIRENVRMRECPASGESILTFAPNSHAAEDYMALAQEMLSRPEAWQKPALWAVAEEDRPPGQDGGFSVNDLRSNAAASVRAAASKAGWRKTAPAATDPLCPPAAPAEAVGTEPDVGTAEPLHPTGSPCPPETPPYGLPRPAFESSGNPPADECPAQPPRAESAQGDLGACLERLTEAAGRLDADPADEVPPLRLEDAEAPPLCEEPEARPSCEMRPPPPPAVTAPPLALAEPAAPADQEPAEPEPAGQPFPALRAFLRDMGGTRGPAAARGTDASGADASDSEGALQGVLSEESR